MQKTIRIVYLVFTSLYILTVLFVPDMYVYAQNEGFVQCGQSGGGPESGCKLRDLFATAGRFVNYLLSGAAVVAVAGVVVGGVKMVTSGGKEASIASGKKAVVNSLIGLAVTLTAYLIVRSLFLLLGFKGGAQPLENPDGFIDSGPNLIQ